MAKFPSITLGLAMKSINKSISLAAVGALTLSSLIGLGSAPALAEAKSWMFFSIDSVRGFEGLLYEAINPSMGGPGANDTGGFVSLLNVDADLTSNALNGWGDAHVSFDGFAASDELLQAASYGNCLLYRDGSEIDLEDYDSGAGDNANEIVMDCGYDAMSSIQAPGDGPELEFRVVYTFKGSFWKQEIYAKTDAGTVDVNVAIGGYTNGYQTVMGGSADGDYFSFLTWTDPSQGPVGDQPLVGWRSQMAFDVRNGQFEADGFYGPYLNEGEEDQVYLVRTDIEGFDETPLDISVSDSETLLFETELVFFDHDYSVEDNIETAADWALSMLGVEFGYCIAAIEFDLGPNTPTDDQCATPPLNPFTTTAESWIEPQNSLDKIQLVAFGNDVDDSEIFFIPEGVTCDLNGIRAQGPILYARDVGNLDDGECTVDESGLDFTPRDDEIRKGAIPVGFDVNFFGTTFSDFYLSTNGVLTFDEPLDDYDLKLSIMGLANESSLIAPFAIDMAYVDGDSNIWVAPTVIDGKDAVIISWENMWPYGNWDDDEEESGVASFQLVLIDDDAAVGGDFTAYFNYAEIGNMDEGYKRGAWVNLDTGVTVGSNLLSAVHSEDFFSFVTTECQVIDDADNYFGDVTSSVLNSWDGVAWMLEGAYFKVESAATQTFSIWEDSSCSTPINVDLAQNVEDNADTYLRVRPASVDSYNSAAVGWFNYDAVSGDVTPAEIFENDDIADLYDGSGAATELISYSYNTDVPGRIVLSQVDGVTQGFTPREYSFENSPNYAAPSGSYLGPVVQEIIPNFQSSNEAKVIGLRLETIDRVSVNGSTLPHRIQADGTVLIDTSSLASGQYRIEFWSAIAGVRLYSTINVQTAATQSVNQKVNAGSFKGYVAVYAKGYEGSRLSAKVGNDWVIVPSIPAATNNLYRHVEFTGAGVDVAVRIYIDRVLIDTINLTTK